MSKRRVDQPAVLLSCFACDPTLGSECYVGWKWLTEVYAGIDTIVLTRRYHRHRIEPAAPPNATFIYVDLPFCSTIDPHSRWMRCYYVLWQLGVLPKVLHLALTRRIGTIHHVTYNNLDFPGVLWAVPGPGFVLGPIGGGQVPPPSLAAYFGRSWRNQRWRGLVKRLAPVNPVLRLALRRARLVLAANTDTARLVQPLLGEPAKLHRLLETAIDRVGLPRPHRGGACRIIWIGRFEPRKAPQLALDIMRRLEQLAPGKFRLAMVGAGILWDQTRAAAAGLRTVDVRPPVPFDQMEQVYAEADILLFTSLQDTSGNVILESQARGLPVVALGHQGAADILAGGGGRLVPVGGRDEVIDGFCAALAELARPERYEAASRDAINNIATHHLWRGKRATFRDLDQRATATRRPLATWLRSMFTGSSLPVPSSRRSRP